MFEIPKMQILERVTDKYFEFFFTKEPCKTSITRHIALVSRAQNYCFWRHNVKSKVRTMFIAGLFSEIIK